MKKAFAFSAALICLIHSAACDGTGSSAGGEPAPLSLPGSLTGPDGMSVDVSTEDSVILYHWMTLEGYTAVDSELVAISSIRDTTLRVFPIQFSEESRNAAQESVNALEIPLPVFLADSLVESTIPLDVLPVAVMFRRGAPPRVETGFGCVQRLSVP